MKKLYISLVVLMSAVAFQKASAEAHAVIFRSEDSWATVYAHYWGGESSSTSNTDGVACTKINGQYWVYAQESTFENIIFTSASDWTNQTSDITVVTELGGYFGKSDNYGLLPNYSIALYGDWNSSNSWSDQYLTWDSGTKFKTGPLTATGSVAKFGFRICADADDTGKTAAWLTISGNLESEVNSQTLNSTSDASCGVILPQNTKYHLTVDFSNLNVEVVVDSEATTDPDIIYIPDNPTYDDLSASELLSPFHIVSFSTTASSTTKIKNLSANVVASGLSVEYSWVKYEDTSSYTAGQHLASDNPWSDDSETSTRTWSIDNSKSTTHECRNFSDAYYRIYMESKTDRPAAQTLAAVDKSNLESASRVARTIPVPDNTTGVEEVISDNVAGTDDAGAPAVYYNLQGVRVDNPSDGIYIRIQGKSVSKVLVRQ